MEEWPWTKVEKAKEVAAELGLEITYQVFFTREEWAACAQDRKEEARLAYLERERVAEARSWRRR